MPLRKPKSKEEFFARERETWDALNALVADLPAIAWMQPGAAGEWSLKDVWAHIAAWMKKTRGIMPRLLNGDQVPANIQSFNEEQYLKNRNVSLDIAWRRIERERNQILTMIKKIPEEQLLKSSRVYSWASFSTFNHYHEHIPALKKFRRMALRKARNVQSDLSTRNDPIKSLAGKFKGSRLTQSLLDERAKDRQREENKFTARGGK